MRHRKEKPTTQDHAARRWWSQDSNVQIPGSCPRGAALGGPQVLTAHVRTPRLHGVRGPRLLEGHERGGAWRGRGSGDAHDDSLGLASRSVAAWPFIESARALKSRPRHDGGGVEKYLARPRMGQPGVSLEGGPFCVCPVPPILGLCLCILCSVSRLVYVRPSASHSLFLSPIVSLCL